MLLNSTNLFGQTKGPCPVCGTPLCTCRGANEPYIGRPLDLAAWREGADGTMTRIRAENDIIVPKPGQPGAGTLLYKAGEMIREEDLEALGLAQAKPAAAPQDKAKRGPRDAPKRTRASRDKALADPNESKED